MTTLGALLEKARTARGLSQEAAALELGATPVTYRGWLRGQRPGYGRLSMLVEFTGATESDIVNAIREGGQHIPGYLNPWYGLGVTAVAS